MDRENKAQLLYILPNSFTALSIFMGVLSVIYSVKGSFDYAAYLIFVSLILDGLDGRVARMTGTTSKFGMEFDSQADIISFGIAPAMLFYYAIGVQYGKLGTLIAAVYVIFGAIRLARFNVTNQKIEPSVFIGVPIPTAAVFIAVWVLLVDEYSVLKEYTVAILLLVALVSALMVSNIRFPSFKKIDMQKTKAIKVLVVIILIFSMIYLYPRESIAFLMTSYILYGLIRAILNFALNKKIKV
jgi:CDP-diacylglycerol--serine O-phosphatidyltransferase